MNILCVDDEQAALNRLVSRVKNVVTNCTINQFDDAKAALQFVKESKQNVDIAFLDIEMMDVDGISLAKEIKNIDEKTKVIFVTGFDKYAIESYRMHMDGYILKPVTEEAIKEHFDYFFGSSRKLEATCFGNFSLRFDGKDIHFKRKKSLEFIAILINERGGNVSTKQLIETLFCDYNDTTRKMFSTVASDAKSSLENLGFDSIIITSYGMYSIDVNMIDCDYLKALDGDEENRHKYFGEYMKQYKWAENLNKALEGKLGE